MGKLIVIEGLDGCGKSTQLEMLEKRLSNLNKNVRTVSFPNYSSDACYPVKMYLNGEFGTEPKDVNAYAASAFYAVDRFASYKKDWQRFYNDGGTVICGRYVTSNVLHQCSKLDESEWEKFGNWLYDFEYNKMGIPKPDAVIFLNMPETFSEKLLSVRYGGDESKKDIHEKDIAYQQRCRRAALKFSKIDNWRSVDCVNGNTLRTKEDISNEIFDIVNEVLK